MKASVQHSVGSAMLACSIFVRKGIASFGVDIQTARFAPLHESIGVNCDLLDDHPLPALEIAEIFRFLEPLFPGFRKHLRIFHHGKDTGVVLSSVPDDADSPDGQVHDVLRNNSSSAIGISDDGDPSAPKAQPAQGFRSFLVNTGLSGVGIVAVFAELAAA